LKRKLFGAALACTLELECFLRRFEDETFVEPKPSRLETEALLNPLFDGSYRGIRESSVRGKSKSDEFDFNWDEVFAYASYPKTGGRDKLTGQFDVFPLQVVRGSTLDYGLGLDDFDVYKGEF